MPQSIAASQAFITEDIRLTMRAMLATHESTRRMFPGNAGNGGIRLRGFAMRSCCWRKR
jgi:hypothetical protein